MSQRKERNFGNAKGLHSKDLHKQMPFPAMLPQQPPFAMFGFSMFILQTLNFRIRVYILISSIENALSSKYPSARLPFLPHSTLCLKITFWWESNWLRYFKFPSSHSLLCLAFFFPRHLWLLKPEIPYRLLTRHVYTHKAEGRCVCSFTVPACGRHAVHIPQQTDNEILKKTTICPHGLPFSARSKEISYSQLFLGGNLVHGWETDICKDWHKETALGAPPLHNQYFLETFHLHSSSSTFTQAMAKILLPLQPLQLPIPA